MCRRSWLTTIRAVCFIKFIYDYQLFRSKEDHYLSVNFSHQKNDLLCSIPWFILETTAIGHCQNVFQLVLIDDPYSDKPSIRSSSTQKVYLRHRVDDESVFVWKPNSSHERLLSLENYLHDVKQISMVKTFLTRLQKKAIKQKFWRKTRYQIFITNYVKNSGLHTNYLFKKHLFIGG